MTSQENDKKMNTEGFRVHGKNVVDYICNYNSTLSSRQVAPTMDPGFLKKLIPGMFDQFIHYFMWRDWRSSAWIRVRTSRASFCSESEREEEEERERELSTA